jgi:hypothetical protein
VSTFQERLTLSVEGYRGRQATDGSWGENPWEGAPGSIVNTVEVLAVMRASGVLYEDTTVQRALTYLSEAVVSHPQRRRDDGRPGEGENGARGEFSEGDARGAHTRYCAWGLSGLTLYKASRHDARLADAQRHCVTWLAEHEWAGRGAWGETPEDEHPSLLSTSAAITGLTRVCARHPSGDDASELVRRARAVIRSLALRTHGAQPTASWPARPNAPHPRGNASATAMAVIALAGGDPEDRVYAGEGARWLLAHKDEWADKIELDAFVPDANWQHMTFSLALRAILRGIHLPSSDHTLRPVVRYLDELWLEQEYQWSHGVPEARPSPSGSYAVVTAYEAMANAWPFDAQREILGERSTVGRSGKPAQLRVHVDHENVTLVSYLDQSQVAVTLPARLAEMMNLLAQRHCEGAESGKLDEKSWDVLELADALGGKEIDTVKHYMRDINRLLQDGARREGKTIGEIVQLMQSSTSRGRRRMLINVDKVTVDLDPRRGETL